MDLEREIKDIGRFKEILKVFFEEGLGHYITHFREHLPWHHRVKAHLSKNKRSINDYSKEGGLEFWSSGGLMHEIDPNGRPEVYDYANVKPKHIEVIVLVPGMAAVAMYYSEGA